MKHPNKRLAIKQDVRKKRIIDFLQNIWTVRHFVLENYKTDPVIISADQMPLHRNESRMEKTLNFNDQTTYVKENYQLSRERPTVMTAVCSNSKKKVVKPKFLFKEAGVILNTERKT